MTERSASSNRLAIFFCALLVPACGGTSGDADAGSPPGDAARPDGNTGRSDASPPDGSAALDAGTDATTVPDTGPGSDTGPTQAFDAGTDAGTSPGDAGELPDLSLPPLPDSSVADAALPPPCTIGFDRCGASNECVELATDATNCGVCGRRCSGPRVLGAGCFGGSCMISGCEPLYADVNGSPLDGCEAMQDYQIAVVPSTLTVSAGGSASVEVRITRTNGFNFPIYVNALGAPAAVNVLNAGFATGETHTLTFSAVNLASASSTQVTINASASGGVSLLRSQTITLNVTTSPVRVTSTEVYVGPTLAIANTVRQGHQNVRLVLLGTGLLTITSAMLEASGLTLTPIAGATDTRREYTTDVPTSFGINGESRALTLTLTSVTGGTTVASALVVSRITAAPTGDDTALGTTQQPFRTLTRALAVARNGSSVLLRPGTYTDGETWPTAAPNVARDVREVGGDGTGTVQLRCASTLAAGAGRTGLWVTTATLLRNLTVENCATGVRLEDGEGQRFVLDGVQVVAVTRAVQLPSATLFRASRTRLGGVTPLAFDGGLLFLDRCSVDAPITTVNTDVAVADSDLYGSSAGDALTLGPSPNPIALTRARFYFASGAGPQLVLAPGADVVAEDLTFAPNPGGFLQFPRNAIRMTSARLRLSGVSIGLTVEDAIYVDGAGSVLSLLDSPSNGPNAIDRAGRAGITLAPTGGTTALELGTLAIRGSGTTGIAIRNAAGATTNVRLRGALRLESAQSSNLLIDGGTTNLDFDPGATLGLAELGAPPSSGFRRLVDVLSGNGTLRFPPGTWRTAHGIGLRMAAPARHTVQVGGPTTRDVTFDLTGHPANFAFGVQDERTTPASPAILVRARFIGGDGVTRTWSGTYDSPNGSYFVAVTPKDSAAWIVAGDGRLDFGAP